MSKCQEGQRKMTEKGRRQRNPSVPIKCPNMALPFLVPCVEIQGITNQVAPKIQREGKRKMHTLSKLPRKGKHKR
jgi:hypothetical protein